MRTKADRTESAGSDDRGRPRRRKPRGYPTAEALEGRALLAVAFSSLPFQGPGSFATGSDGDYYFTAATPSDKVGRITPSGALAEFTVPSHFDAGPVAEGPDGNIWFGELGNSTSAPHQDLGRIGRITPSGQVAEFHLHLEGVASISETVGDIEAGPDGDVWFVDYRTPSTGGATTTLIGRITPSGRITMYADPDPSVSDGYGNFARIAGGSDGDLYFTEPLQGEVGRLDPSTGQVAQIPLPGKQEALAIAPGPDGNVWFTQGMAVGRITPGGAVSTFAAPDISAEGPDRIAIGPDGNVWFTEADGVGRATTAGVVTEFATPQAGDSPLLIGIGPQRALLYADRSGDNPLGVIDTDATAAPPTATGLSATAPQYESLAARVAHFTGNDPQATLADYRAVVHYGKLAGLQGVIAPDPSGGYDVFVSVPVQDDVPGTYPGTVTIFDTRTGGSSMATVASTLVITTGPAAGTGASLSLTPGSGGSASASGIVGQIGNLPASTYTATISFGDGTPTVSATVAASTRLVKPDAGTSYELTTFTATATHRYAHPGGYIATVTFRDKSGDLVADDALVVVQ